MPRKKSDENLTKVISSIISPEDFGILEEYAKLFYNGNVLKLANDFTLGTVYFEQLGKRYEKERSIIQP